jgi:hypothetical protein
MVDRCVRVSTGKFDQEMGLKKTSWPGGSQFENFHLIIRASTIDKARTDKGIFLVDSYIKQCILRDNVGQ